MTLSDKDKKTFDEYITAYNNSDDIKDYVEAYKSCSSMKLLDYLAECEAIKAKAKCERNDGVYQDYNNMSIAIMIVLCGLC